MGNYREGRLEFIFKQGKESADLVAEALRYELYGRDKIREKYAADTKDNLFIKGMNTYTYKNLPNEYHNIDVFLWDDNTESCLDVDRLNVINCLELESGAESLSNEEFIDHVFDKTIEYFDKDSIDKIDKSDIYVVVCFYICEQYNNDENLVKLIDLWSPYIINTYIGTIKDEDHTFRKDYYKDNQNLSKHFGFCGSWCPLYYTEAACPESQEELCQTLYKIGFKDGKNNTSQAIKEVTSNDSSRDEK